MAARAPGFLDLVLVPGHASLREGVAAEGDLERDEFWVLHDFQAGEPPLYAEHVRRGVELAAAQPRTLLVFSGGRTRPDSGPWSEAASYLELARRRGWWCEPSQCVQREQSTLLEEFARDSFENLALGLCRFAQEVGRYPRRVTVVGFGFKAERFELHREALRFPRDRFSYRGVNDPEDLAAAHAGEAATRAAFRADPYGLHSPLADKRRRRDPTGREHAYAELPDLAEFFAFLAAAAPGGGAYPGRLPWEPRGSARSGRSRSGLPVLHADAQVVVVDKPAGLPSVASAGSQGRTCASEVRRQYPAARPVHRLDRETSGAMAFALDPASLKNLEQAFRSRRVEKVYLALVRGSPRPATGVIERPIEDRGKTAALARGGRPAETEYRVLESLGSCSLVEARPRTGRHNQIRLHFAGIGHPLIGERKYARGRESPVRFRRVALHASRLSLPHPSGHGRVTVEAPLPADLARLLEELRGSRS